jgi:TusE/DsrC/DsvC family sulfur relay protein
MTTLQHLTDPARTGLDTHYDDHGFLLDPLDWSRETARYLARLEGVDELTLRHWAVIEHMRDRYLGSDELPNMRQVCKATGLDRQEITHLFGGCRTIWRIAGLPNPGTEALAYMH